MNLGNGEKIGVLGGGQLGLMLHQASENFNVDLSFLDPDPQAPCSKTPGFLNGDFKDEHTVWEFGKDKDIITIEIENVNTNGLKKLKRSGVTVFPDPILIETVKDKGLQKQFFLDHDIPTSGFRLFNNREDYIQSIASYPIVQKLRTGGYDGRGVQLLKSKEDINKTFDAPSVMEEFIEIDQEVSVIVARNEAGEIKCFPSVGMDFNHEANLVEYLYSPSGLNQGLEKKATEIAHKTAETFNLIGIMAVEMFLTKKGNILVNEVAPRPHNSGHHTIEGNITSQYQQHLRAILNLQLGSTEMTKPAVMVNLLGAKGHEGPVKYTGIEHLEKDKDVFIHLYGKQVTRPFRKMGHITVLKDNLNEAVSTAKQIKEMVACIS